MNWLMILMLFFAIPVVLIPVAFVWYLNISGTRAMIEATRARARRAKNFPSQLIDKSV